MGPVRNNSLRKTAVYHHRLSKNMTLQQLENRSGISFTRLQHYEIGTRMPRVDAALAVARALGTTVEELFSDVS